MQHSRHHLTAGVFAALATGWLAAGPGGQVHADVIVLSNRCSRPVQFTIFHFDGSRHSNRLAPGDLVPVRAQGKVGVKFTAGEEEEGYTLSPDSIYFFYEDSSGELNLQQIGIGAGNDTLRPLPVPDRGKEPLPKETIGVIPVKVLTDEEQRARTEIWQELLTKRFEEASDLFERYCRIRFEIVEFATWNSDDLHDNYERALTELEREVDPGGASIVIGFTSQFRRPSGPFKLGGTRGPLHPYILIREWPQAVSEPERLEILVHELGHHLGGIHSPELDSVLRPVLGDRQSLARKFRIKFDPVNTLVLNLVSEEIRSRKISRLNEISPARKIRLWLIYHDMAGALAGDNSARRYQQMLGDPTRTYPVTESPVRVLPRSATDPADSVGTP